MYDLTTWFSTGSNTNTSFTASWNTTVRGIPNPTSYVFTQPVSTVTITQKDNIVAGCSKSVTVRVIQAPYECLYLDYIKTKALIPGLESPQEVEISYTLCNGGVGGEEITTYAGQDSFDEDTVHSFGVCIVSGSLTTTGYPLHTIYYSASGICTI